jgi:hypothetical protein
MKSRKIILVVKDNFMTAFAQNAEVFEKFKFCGALVEATAKKELTAKEILSRGNSKDNNFTLVGVIIPNAESCFLPEYKVYSNGEQWITVENLCKGYDAL